MTLKLSRSHPWDMLSFFLSVSEWVLLSHSAKKPDHLQDKLWQYFYSQLGVEKKAGFIFQPRIDHFLHKKASVCRYALSLIVHFVFTVWWLSKRPVPEHTWTLVWCYYLSWMSVPSTPVEIYIITPLYKKKPSFCLGVENNWTFVLSWLNFFQFHCAWSSVKEPGICGWNLQIL